MKPNSLVMAAVLLASTTALPACARAPNAGVEKTATQASPAAAPRPAAASASPALPRTAQALPVVIVNKSPSCGCCGAWVEHLRKAGFQVEVRDSDDLEPIKQRVGVPFGKGSCHTAEVGGYFVEGHVPADDIKRLLAQKPDAKGLVLPGMPAGSPGMERPDGSAQPYTVELVGRDGAVTAFAQH